MQFLLISLLSTSHTSSIMDKPSYKPGGITDTSLSLHSQQGGAARWNLAFDFAFAVLLPADRGSDIVVVIHKYLRVEWQSRQQWRK